MLVSGSVTPSSHMPTSFEVILVLRRRAAANATANQASEVIEAPPMLISQGWLHIPED